MVHALVPRPVLIKSLDEVGAIDLNRPGRFGAAVAGAPTGDPALARFPVTTGSSCNRMRQFDRHMLVKAGKVR